MTSSESDRVRGVLAGVGVSLRLMTMHVLPWASVVSSVKVASLRTGHRFGLAGATPSLNLYQGAWGSSVVGVDVVLRLSMITLVYPGLVL